MKTITKAYINNFRTERGAWSYVQLKALGIGWPPPPGWRAKIEGKSIDDATAALFESGRTILSQKTLRRHEKQAALHVSRAFGVPVPEHLQDGYRPPPLTAKGLRKAAKRKARRLAKAAKVAELEIKLARPEAATQKPQAKSASSGAPTPQSSYVNSDAFLSSFEWRKVRMVALKKYGARCQCCGDSPETGAVMNVDHIKPRRLFPQLALDVDNLQILCGPCNHGKGSWDMTDWRPSESIDLDEDAAAHMRSIMRES